MDKWATVKYERLSDFCYGCGRLGHTSQVCVEEIAKLERDPEFPKFGPWLVGTRQRIQNRSFQIGGQRNNQQPVRDPNRRTWRDMMSSASAADGGGSSSRGAYNQNGGGSLGSHNRRGVYEKEQNHCRRSVHDLHNPQSTYRPLRDNPQASHNPQRTSGPTNLRSSLAPTWAQGSEQQQVEQVPTCQSQPSYTSRPRLSLDLNEVPDEEQQ